jgi:hypothetical protein
MDGMMLEDFPPNTWLHSDGRSENQYMAFRNGTSIYSLWAWLPNTYPEVGIEHRPDNVFFSEAVA